MRRGKKGVSEVVAAMLLITITVAASVIFYVYSSGLLGSLTGAQPRSGQYSNQITLEYYDWTAVKSLIITIRNVGSGIANVAAFYVSGIAVSFSGSTCVSSTITATATVLTKMSAMNPTSSCTITLTITGLTITSGVAYTMKVVTKDGGVFTYSCVAGQKTGSY